MTATAADLDSSHLLDDPEALRARFDENGFIFLRGLIDRDAILEVRRDVLTALDSVGWLEPGSDPQDAKPGPVIHREDHDDWYTGYTAIQRLYSFHALAHRDDLLRPLRALIDGEVMVHPRKIARCTYPGSGYPTPPHQDFPLVQGNADTYTLWTPFGSADSEIGALRVLPGSHREGLQQLVPRDGVTGMGVSVPDDDPRFVTPDYEPGDAIIFLSLTVHHAPPNRGDRLRLSGDYRFQAASDPVTEASLAPHAHPIVPGWEVLTEGWPSLDPIRIPESVNVGDFSWDWNALPQPPSRHMTATS